MQSLYVDNCWCLGLSCKEGTREVLAVGGDSLSQTAIMKEGEWLMESFNA